MIFVTGDTHADFGRFATKAWREQKKLTRDDYVIVCGDFGGVWDFAFSSKQEKNALTWLAQKTFTILFCDGNHENFDRLASDFPVVDFCGGKAHQIADNIYHLMRGYVFTIDGYKFFVFGGASSHDIDDGVLDPKDWGGIERVGEVWRKNARRGLMQRIKYISWWEQELPSEEEKERGIQELAKHNFEVDFVISHCLPQDVATMAGFCQPDDLTMYFNDLITVHNLKFRRWHCGHYHRTETLMGKFNIHYEDIERIT